MTSRRKMTQNDKLLAHAAQGDKNPAEAAVATTMLVARGNPTLALDVADLDVTAIVKRAEQALELALTVPDIKRVRDEAITIADYMARRGYSEGAVAAATRLIRLAEYKAGQELIRMAETGERGTEAHHAGSFAGVTPGDRRFLVQTDDALTTLAKLGVPKNSAFLWQRLAKSVPSVDLLDEWLTAEVANGRPITFAAVERQFAPVIREVIPHPTGWPKLVERVKADAAALYASMGAGDPLQTEHTSDEWGTEADEFEQAIRQLVVFLRAMQVYRTS